MPPKKPAGKLPKAPRSRSTHGQPPAPDPVPFERLPEHLQEQLRGTAADAYAALRISAHRYLARLTRQAPQPTAPSAPPAPPSVYGKTIDVVKRATMEHRAKVTAFDAAQRARESHARTVAAESVEAKNWAETLHGLSRLHPGLLESLGGNGDAVQLNDEAELLAGMRAKAPKKSPQE